MLTRVKQLVHVHDLWSPANAEPWTINPRTGFLETRAPLTWTGVRDYYPKPGERVRVLRRPEQVEAPKHLARCRMLTATEGHPTGDAKVSPANVDVLKVGYTGDEIMIKEIDGYRCPTARVVATRASTQTKIQQGKTQTSLGYHALWVGPPDDERGVDPQGVECGVWQGPHGPEYYDLEHILDPDCELVQTLVREAKFDPEVLGPNHFAIALDRGRGGVQSELMRVVDSIDVWSEDAAMPEAKWTAGTSTELPFAPPDTEWDGDKAAASVFAWAGFDSDKPDPSRARQAFLAYDANAPELKGSYKLPIARHRDGAGLEVVKAGLDAAAGYLDQTHIPEDVRDRARNVLDAYYEKFRKQQGTPARDHAPAHAGSKMTTKQLVQLALPRDFATWATKHNIPVPLATKDEMDPEIAGKVLEYCSGIEAMCASMREMMGGMESEIEDMKAEAGATSSKVSELEAQKMELEKQIEAEKAKMGPAVDAMKQTCDELNTKLAAATQTVDALTREVAPLREAELVRVRAMAVKAGVTKDAADKMTTLADLRRASLIAKLPSSAQTFRDAADDAVALAFTAIEGTLRTPAALATPAKAEPPTAPMPSPSLGRQTNDAAQPPAEAPPSQLRRVAGALSGKPIG